MAPNEQERAEAARYLRHRRTHPAVGTGSRRGLLVEVEDDYLFIIWKRPSPAMFRNARVFQVESLGVHVHPGG